MAGSLERRDELLDLLVEKVTFGLEAPREAELDELLPEDAGREEQELERAVAAAAIAFVRRDASAAEMPASLKERLASASLADVPRASVVSLDERREQRRQEAKTTAPAPNAFGRLGWAVAAGLAILLVLWRPQVSVESADYAELRAELVDSSDAIQLSWGTELPDDQWQSVQGDVVWSNETQSGYMRFVGLPVNDAQTSQYQLWIVDPSRDTHPVDGGVFDVTETGEVIVPIQAKLTIGDPKAFAITVEKPGGVVVSDGPLVLVAAAGPRPQNS